MKRLTAVGALLCAYCVLPISQSFAKDVSGMYSPAILQQWKVNLERWVNDIISQEIKPALWPDAKRILQNTTINVPVVSPSNDPFDYHVKGHTLTIPTLSVKFLYDLMAARLWLNARGFEDKSLPYLMALKYQDANAFPGGRYLSPFEALGVPHKKSMDLTNNEPDITPAFQQLFNGALLFLIAHEVGHLVPQAKEGMTAAEREAAADFFAFAILARSQFNPAGVLWLFIYLGVWVGNAADFATTQDYLRSIENDPHPLTAARLMIVGSQLANEPHRFYPGVADSDPRIPLIKLLGSKMIDLAKDLNDLASRKELRDVAREIQIPSLAVHKKSNDLGLPIGPK